MNDILKYYVNNFSSITKSLKKQAIFLEKPWAFIDEDGEIQKLIFKKDKGLIISKNGKVKEGKWDYFPEAKSLLIDRVPDKLLLSEQFIDENVLILKKDGTDNDFFALANENKLPDYNVPKYLNNLKKVELKIYEQKLFNGNILQIPDCFSTSDFERSIGDKVDLFDKDYNILPIKDGAFLSNNKNYTFYIENGRIKKIYNNFIIHSIKGESYIIENVSYLYGENAINKKITVNGAPLHKTDRIETNDNLILNINDSIICNVNFIVTYELSNKYTVRIEQKNQYKISKGDRVIRSAPISPIPDGKYKVKGSFFKSIVIKDSVII